MQTGDRKISRVLIVRTCALAALSTLAVSGAIVAVWIHFETFLVRSATLFRSFWILQLVLSALLIPLIAEVLLRRNVQGVVRGPRWMQNVLRLLLLYYGFNFYVFLYRSGDYLDGRLTWRMFSSGWVLLFAIAVVYYCVRLAESSRTRFGPRH